MRSLPGGFPVARRAAHEESIWLPHELFLGGSDDVADLVTALTRLRAGAPALRDRPPAPGPDRPVPLDKSPARD